MLQFQDSGSSFYQLLTSNYPHLLPSSSGYFGSDKQDISLSVPHGTTILALHFRDGVVIAGDRRATEGTSISERRIEKVHKTDQFSAIAFAGAAGPCLDLTRLFQVELEHYEKLEGVELSAEGKANKLAQMVKGNLPLAMQGLVVIPIFAAYDINRASGRIFKYDVVGGQYEETDFYAVGSGGRDAKGSLKKIYKKNLSREEAVGIAVEALYDAAEGDSATGGPDLIRGIFPTLKVLDSVGVVDVAEEEIKRITEGLIARQEGA